MEEKKTELSVSMEDIKKAEFKGPEKSAQEMNLYEKMYSVMVACKPLTKDLNVKFVTKGGKEIDYNAISEEAVLTEIRKHIEKYRLAVFPIKVTQEYLTDKQLTLVHCTYLWVDIDHPTERIEVQSVGQGHDLLEKGSGNALTYSFKCMILKQFVIPQGNDPERHTSEEGAEMAALRQEREDLIRNVKQAYGILGASAAQVTDLNTKKLGTPNLSAAKIEKLKELKDYLNAEIDKTGG